jgi:hypothetical protein
MNYPLPCSQRTVYVLLTGSGAHCEKDLHGEKNGKARCVTSYK